MKKNEKLIFEQLQTALKMDTTFRSCDNDKCLQFICNEMLSLYNDNIDIINYKLAIDNLNEYASNIEIITNDSNLFDGSFKINGCWEQHIFGSTRNLMRLCDDVWYTSEQFRLDVMSKIMFNDIASKLFVYILVDIYANGLINVDIRNNQPARNILNDIQYIINYMLKNTYGFENILDVINMLTFGKNNVFDAINYKRYDNNSYTDELLELDINNILS